MFLFFILSLLAANWNAGVTNGGISFSDALTQVELSGAGIPEPGTLALLGAGAIYALGRRKRFGGGGGTARGYEDEERGRRTYLGNEAREGRK